MKNFHGEVSASYLQKAAEFFFPVKQYGYEQMRISQGDAVLDVGCGPGIDIEALSKQAGVDSDIVGIDHDYQMLKKAAQHFRQHRPTGRVSLIHGGADALPFSNNHFDSCRSERLFMHLKDPEKVLSEMKRVVKPNGIVAITETDWSSLSIDTQLPGIERMLSHYRITQMMNNGYSGRSLYRQFKCAGFSDITIQVFPIYTTNLELFYSLSVQQTVEEQALANRALTQREFNDWRDDLNSAAGNDCFYACINTLVISAQKSG